MTELEKIIELLEGQADMSEEMKEADERTSMLGADTYNLLVEIKKPLESIENILRDAFDLEKKNSLTEKLKNQKVDDTPKSKKKDKKEDKFTDLSAASQGFLGAIIAGPGAIGALAALAVSFKAASGLATDLQVKLDEMIQGGAAFGFAFVAATKKIVDLFRYTFVTLPGKFFSGIKFIGSFFKVIGDAIKALGNVIGGPFKLVFNIFKVLGKFSGALSILIIAFDALVAGVKEFQRSGSIISAIGAALVGAAKSIISTITGLYDILKWLTMKVAEAFGIERFIAPVFGAIEEFSSGIAWAFGMFTDSLKFIGEKMGITSESAMSVFLGIESTVASFFSGLMSFVMNPIQAINDFTDYIGSFINWEDTKAAIMEGATASLVSFVNGAKSVFGWFINPGKKLADLFFSKTEEEPISEEEVRAQLEAITAGIKKVGEWAVAKFENIRNSVLGSGWLSDMRDVLGFGNTDPIEESLIAQPRTISDEEMSSFPARLPATRIQEEMRKSELPAYLMAPTVVDASSSSSSQTNISHTNVTRLDTTNTSDPAF